MKTTHISFAIIATLGSSVLLAPASGLAQTATPAEAPAAAPASPFTGNMTIASDYIFRGLTQTKGKPAIQGGFDYAHPSGFYVGTWLSNISWFTDQDAGTKSVPYSLASPVAAGVPPYAPSGSNQASLEWDVYGGYKNSFAGGDWNYDVGVLTYNYPGTYDNLGPYRKPDTTEVYGALGYKWLTLKYSKAISTYTFGVNESKGADYIDLSASVPLGDSGVTLLAHAGHQRYPSNANVAYWGTAPGHGDNSYFSYTDYKLGVSKDFAGCTFALAATHTNAKDSANDSSIGYTTAYMNAFLKNTGKSTVVASVTKTF
jgi:uncharacterized protein (TIGR02001 family)